MTVHYDYDLFVIGAGSGGVRAARIAASHGARVAIAEEYRYGGTCVIRGCIPKKLFVYAAELAEELSHARHYGWDFGEPSHDWTRLVAAKDAEIDRLSGIYRGILHKFAVEMFDGRATVKGPHEVEVCGKKKSARYILVATGGTPFIPDVEGREHAISSNEAFHLDSLPAHITIVGGGYIALEFASIFHGLGREVSLVYRRDVPLRGFDDDVREAVTEAMGERGVELVMPADIGVIEPNGSGGYELTMTDGKCRHTDLVMYATGRLPNTDDLGLGETGVELGPRGEVVVDDYSKSSVDSIYAVGDVTDRLALTPVAIREGHAVADTLFGNRPTRVDHGCVPSAVFSLPHVGTVGLTEHDARQQYGQIDVYKSSFRPLKRTVTDDQEKVMIKLVVAPEDDDRVLGVHIVGNDGPEIVQAAAIAVAMGASKEDFDRTLALHPTTAEELVLMRTKHEPKLPTS